MDSVGAGYHELTVSCTPGARYRYRLPSGLSVPDPASRMQDGDVHDASVVLDMQAYHWVHDDWTGRPWEDTVLYEIHSGLAGGFDSLREQLPKLAALGITAIELMPVADFPGKRNWGYDGVLPYAPDGSYGTPNDLKRLIDIAHGLGVMVFLDVVYNHFGPEGNYLSHYAPDFFRDDVCTPWGPAIDFRQPAVRRFFAENALYWLRDYRFDGLRFDAVHAMHDEGWLKETADFVRSRIDPRRHVHLVLENDANTATLLRSGFVAQWNDDAHHVIHHLLTGESSGYYVDYVDNPAGKLARALSEGFVYQGDASTWRSGDTRGEPSAELPPTAFVFFLQNHDQTGNRALGERLTALCAHDPDSLKAAVALQLLAPHIPMLFMGEEYGVKAPFLYFVDFSDEVLANAAREGRKREFGAFFATEHVDGRCSLPNPADERTWALSRIEPDALEAEYSEGWFEYYRSLLTLRAREIAPHLPRARSRGAKALSSRAVMAEWVLGNGSNLAIYTNFGQKIHLNPKDQKDNLAVLAECTPVFESRSGAAGQLLKGCLPAGCTVVLLQAVPDTPNGIDNDTS
jgi:maltooligosyltrehalose trehalohydrolase|tara:strand:- start:23672 stop:25387 length:1716 start_codon:yes stop_codon:yes gene_type:complete